MDLEDFKNALFKIGRERNDAVYRLNRLTEEMTLGRRALNIQEDAINDELRREVEGTGEIGELSRRIKDLGQNEVDLHGSFIADALADRGRRLTAAGPTEAVFTLLRAHGKPMRTDEVEALLFATGFDIDTLENPRAAIAKSLGELGDAGRVRFVPELDSYGLTLNEMLR